METTTLLCILVLCLYLTLAVFWIVRSILDAIDDHKRDKRNAEWEAERLQLEKERAARDEEYHQKRMEQFDK
jgi:cell division protein FtsL